MKFFVLLNVILFLFTDTNFTKRDNDWNVKSTEEFDLYYLELDKTIVDKISKLCHSEYDRLVDMLGLSIGKKVHIPDKKNAFMDFRISIYLDKNLDLNAIELVEPKQILKREILINPSIHPEAFEHKLKFMISQIIVGNISAGQFTNRRKMILSKARPWFYYGAAYYLSSLKIENTESTFINEISTPKQLEKLTGLEAMYMGARIFDNLEQTYGPSYFANILNLHRIICNKERAISGTLGIDYDEVIMSLL